MIKYSILIPVYNVRSYLMRCIESAVNQLFPTEAYEIVITDDGSTDGSSDICDEVVRLYSNVRVIHQQNKGLLQARLTGVRNANGKYLLFMDSDDYVSDKLLSTVDKYVDEYDPDMLMYGIARVEGGRITNYPLIQNEFEVLNKENILRRYACSDNFNSMALKVIRRELYCDHVDEICDERANISEDRMQTALLLKYVTKTVLINKCLYYYVIHNSSMVHGSNLRNVEEFTESHIKALELYTEAMDNSELTQIERKELIYRFKRLALNGIMEHIFKINNSVSLGKQDKIAFLSELDIDKNCFFDRVGLGMPLKWYNLLRCGLLKNRYFSLLYSLDQLLKAIQKLSLR